MGRQIAQAPGSGILADLCPVNMVLLLHSWKLTSLLFIKNFYYDAEQESIVMYVQKLTDIHLHSRLDYEIRPNSNYAYIIVLTVIAVFLLIIAAINFMNLSTATAGSRAREIGIRKVTGADRYKLIIQFIGESLVLTLIAFILSLLLIEVFLPSSMT